MTAIFELIGEMFVKGYAPYAFSVLVLVIVLFFIWKFVPAIKKQPGDRRGSQPTTADNSDSIIALNTTVETLSRENHALREELRQVHNECRDQKQQLHEENRSLREEITELKRKVSKLELLVERLTS